MTEPALASSISSIPPGPWAVGVSGGADSVALLVLLRSRPDLTLHVCHLDHQTRGPASTADASFVADLCQNWSLPCTIARRSDLEPTIPSLPSNPSSRYRAARLALFQRVIAENHLSGVILAHHADDQAETILHRLLRGRGPLTLTGMKPDTHIGPLRVLRPLLAIRRQQLRHWLKTHDLSWREDASNTSPTYLRNRLRRVLEIHPQLSTDLLNLSECCTNLRLWADTTAPHLPTQFQTRQLQSLPSILAETSARRWLLAQGLPPDDITSPIVDRLLCLASDAASPPRANFPPNLLIRRRAGVIWATPGRP